MVSVGGSQGTRMLDVHRKLLRRYLSETLLGGVTSLLLLTVLVTVGCISGRGRERVEAIPNGWPVNQSLASVSSTFGAPRGRSWHQGIDLSAPKGTRVTATATGVVVFASRSGSFGKLVVVDHGNGFETRYAHLKRIKVKKGGRVKLGDVVGTVGKSGNATGYHLHYEVRRNGAPVDPRPYL